MTPFPFAPAAALRALPFITIAALAFAAPAKAIPMDTVVLQGLDKITARVSTIDVPVGGTVAFGALQITARACDKHPPEETPEAAAFLEVVEVKPDEKPVLRFSGWMFASSPALSALEHPVYDLVVLDCINKGGGTDEDAEPPQPAAPSDKKAPDQAPAGSAPSNSSKPSGGSSQ
jgi:hypothetical protein